ncbi:hypothetical protein [Allorhizocola rhizosphaerae]|uniref:hypothetical protein n=1 Tax=Allorhizocola rhizosphaerae TaxID=1872709 RepID=UPI000E3BBB94|nr:hypothetical protein [Allorhizocola rhizosphaerae]
MLRRYPLITILIATLTAGCATTATTPPPLLEEPEPIPPAPAAATTTTCVTSAILVNSCRPWPASDIGWVDAIEGEFPSIITTTEDAHLLINWRPTERWADVTPEQIDEAAAAIESIAPKKIFLALHHAPESGVTRADGCDDQPGEAGTAAEYRAMWQRVRERFEELEVTNVVWVLGYANDPEWDCLVPELYPGDHYVDWIMFDGRAATRFARLLMGMNGPDRQVLTKPWALYGVTDSSLPNIRAYLTTPG